MTDWWITLGALQRHLDLQGELIKHGRYDEVAAFVPPAGLPALPPALVVRASELLGSAQALTDQGCLLRDDTARLLAQHSRPAIARHAVSAFVDRRA